MSLESKNVRTHNLQEMATLKPTLLLLKVNPFFQACLQLIFWCKYVEIKKRKTKKLKEKAEEEACSETTIKFSINSLCPKFLH